MLRVCVLLILAIFKTNQFLGHVTLGHPNTEKNDFNM